MRPGQTRAASSLAFLIFSNVGSASALNSLRPLHERLYHFGPDASINRLADAFDNGLGVHLLANFLGQFGQSFRRCFALPEWASATSYRLASA